MKAKALVPVLWQQQQAERDAFVDEEGRKVDVLHELIGQQDQ